MICIEHTVDVRVPLNIVYRQWTQFESFPYFMQYIHAVQPLSDIKTLWLGEIAGEECEWYAELTLRIPNQLIAWRTTTGQPRHITLRFFRVTDNLTRIFCQIQFAPTGEPAAEADQIKQRLAGDLDRFREYIQDETYDEAMWRGEVERAVAQLWEIHAPEAITSQDTQAVTR